MSSSSDTFLVNGAIDYNQILLDWNETTFRSAVTFYRRDPTNAKPLFVDYAWEIYDRVLEYALSTSTTLVAEVDLLECVHLIAIHSRPREMFLMVTEKAIHAATGVADALTCFTILLYSLQLTTVRLLQQQQQQGSVRSISNDKNQLRLFCDILSLAKKMILDAIAVSNTDHTDRMEMTHTMVSGVDKSFIIVDLAVRYIRGILTGSTTIWNNDDHASTLVHKPTSDVAVGIEPLHHLPHTSRYTVDGVCRHMLVGTWVGHFSISMTDFIDYLLTYLTNTCQ